MKNTTMVNVRCWDLSPVVQIAAKLFVSLVVRMVQPIAFRIDQTGKRFVKDVPWLYMKWVTRMMTTKIVVSCTTTPYIAVLATKKTRVTNNVIVRIA